jgi:hypothetical protein
MADGTVRPIFHDRTDRHDWECSYSIANGIGAGWCPVNAKFDL